MDSILFHRVSDLEFSPWCQPEHHETIEKRADQRKADDGNYLPGLRAVERDSEQYFANDVIWLGY